MFDGMKFKIAFLFCFLFLLPVTLWAKYVNISYNPLPQTGSLYRLKFETGVAEFYVQAQMNGISCSEMLVSK